MGLPNRAIAGWLRSLRRFESRFRQCRSYTRTGCEKEEGVDPTENIGCLAQRSLESRRAGKLYQFLGFRSFGRERRAPKIGELHFDTEQMVLNLADRAPGAESDFRS